MTFDRKAYMQAYNRQYYVDNKESELARSAAWKQAHPEDNASHASAFHRSFHGKISNTYAGMCRRVRGKGKSPHLYAGLALPPRDEFVAWSLESRTYKQLYDAWVAADYDFKLSPSIDRKDSSEGYVFPNIRWVTHSQNSRDGAINSHKAGVRQ